jgi:hypothetical protein
MSRLKQLANLLGISAEKAATLSDDTVKYLQKVDNPHLASSIAGEEREKYLKALDEAYGTKDVRQWEPMKKEVEFTPAGQARNDSLRAKMLQAMQNGQMDKIKEYRQMMDQNAGVYTKVTPGGAVRDVENAAFDPRWKNYSDKKAMMAGVGAIPGMQAGNINPVDTLKHLYGKFEEGRDALSDKLAKAVTGWVPEASKEASESQAKKVMNAATNPVNYVGGAGVIDAGLMAADALPENTMKQVSDRFKAFKNQK